MFYGTGICIVAIAIRDGRQGNLRGKQPLSTNQIMLYFHEPSEDDLVRTHLISRDPIQMQEATGDMLDLRIQQKRKILIECGQ